MGLLDDIGNAVSGAVSSAEKWMSDKAEEARGTLSKGYRDIMNQGIEAVQSITPDFAKEAVGSLGAGYASMGERVLEFLDPVSYALELGSDTLHMAANAPQQRVDAFKRMFQGDLEGGITDLGKSLLDQELLSAQLGLSVIPAGHVAGKAAKKPLKVARKELKQTLKATTNATEKKAVKHDLKTNSTKRVLGVHEAKQAGRSAKALSSSQLRQSREDLGVKSSKKFSPLTRNWEALKQDFDPSSPLMKEGDAIWQQQKTRKEWKRK